MASFKFVSEPTSNHNWRGKKMLFQSTKVVWKTSNLLHKTATRIDVCLKL